MKKCPNCKLEVENNIKACPNCQYDFENSSFKNIPNEKLNKGNKIRYYLMVVLLIAVVLIPELYVFGRKIDRANEREESWNELMAELYGTIESGDYTFEEVEKLAYEDAQVFKPYYDQFIHAVENYHPTGHEVNYYSFHQNRLLSMDMSATIEYANHKFGVSYRCDGTGIIKKEYSFTHEFNLEGNVDTDQVIAFCKYTNLDKTNVIQAIRTFMGNVGKLAFYQENIPLSEGNLLISYRGGGIVGVIYCLNYE